MFAFYLLTALFGTTDQQFTHEWRYVLSLSNSHALDKSNKQKLKRHKLLLQYDRKLYALHAVSDALHALISSNGMYVNNRA